MNPSSNPPTILQGVQSLTLCIQDSLRRRPEEKGAPSPTKRPANAESEVRVRVCVRRGRCLCNRKHVRTFWSQLRRRRRCAASGSPVLPPAADSPSDSAQAEEEREEWEREQQRGGRPDRGRSQRSVSRERWVETMVVADSKLIEYHGSENVESYIFTIMNMVSSLGRSEVFCSLLFTLKIFLLSSALCRWLGSSTTPALGTPSTSSWSVSFCCRGKRYNCCTRIQKVCSLRAEPEETFAVLPAGGRSLKSKQTA